jgi:hypothetical protein
MPASHVWKMMGPCIHSTCRRVTHWGSKPASCGIASCGCRKRLNHILSHMKDRLAGKTGNANNNAFKLRKLFKMHDTNRTGYVRCPFQLFTVPCTKLPG